MDVDFFGYKPELGSRMCVLIATKFNDTPLCSGSFREEDVIELCIKIGHECPKSVLWLSDTEVMPEFKCAFDMVDVTCQLSMVITWQGESVMLQSLPTSSK